MRRSCHSHISCKYFAGVPPDPGDAAAARRKGTGRRGTAGDERGGVGWSRVEKLARQAGKTCERERMLKDEERGGRDGSACCYVRRTNMKFHLKS